MPTPKLKAVGPNDVVAGGKRMTIVEAIDAGDEFAEMKAAHRRAGEIAQDPSTPAAAAVAAMRQQLIISKEIAALKARESKEAADDEATDEEFDSEAI